LTIDRFDALQSVKASHAFKPSTGTCFERSIPPYNSSGDHDLRRTGTVRFFDRDKGFGFIAPEDGSKDVFVHVSSVQGAGVPYLKDGMRLSFETQDDPRGRGQQAIVLQLLAMS
jgi:cold shock protein